MYKLATFFVAALMVLGGCKTVSNISDEDLALGVYVATQAATNQGLKLVFKNNPDRIEQIKADATKAVTIIRANVLPVFDGASTDVVLRSAVDAALDNLAGNLNQTTIDTIKLALAIAATKIELPANPTDQLSPRTKGAVAAFFRGVADGLERAINEAPTPTPTQNRSELTWPN